MKQLCKLTALLLVVLLLCGCTSGAPLQSESPVPTTVPTEGTEATQDSFDPGLTVHFLDVGQADCALIECDNSFALIDGGNTLDGPTVVTYLEQQGVQRLNLVVATHPHEDHIGGLPEVLKAFPADNIWSSDLPYRNSNVYALTEAVTAQSKQLQYPQPGFTFRLGSATITVLGPVHSNYEDVNNLSLVLMVEYGEIRFLFTGDMERDAEIELLDSGADVKADVLKVGHHGSYSSTSYRFLREVAPTYGVISVGAANDYGHPHEEPMSRLRDAEVTIFRTDKMYTVVAATDGQEIRFTWGNEYAKPWTPE